MIYEKNDELKKGEEIVINKNHIQIPNYGSDYGFLYHIIKNYDKLYDIEIFTKTYWNIHKGVDLFKEIDECDKYKFKDFWKKSGTKKKVDMLIKELIDHYLQSLTNLEYD